jgi:hypothetical protein
MRLLNRRTRSAGLSGLLGLAFLLSLAVGTSGCLIRSEPRRGTTYRESGSHRHEHCHYRGGKHHKRVCHSHPHGSGHH